MNPLWKYKDNLGKEHIGYVRHVSDFGGSDVVYQFTDGDTGELSVLSERQRIEYGMKIFILNTGKRIHVNQKKGNDREKTQNYSNRSE